MGYPSLLYKTEPKLKPMDLSVFEDLQLLNFIPRSVAKAVRVPCETENILVRQKLFRSLEDKSAKKHFERLYEISKNLITLSKIYSSSRCNTERNAVFFSLMQAEREFASEAAVSGFGDPLSDCFASAFRQELSGKLYCCMIKDAKTLKPDFDKILDLSFRIHGEEVRSGKTSGDTYLSRIEGCASVLGLEKLRVRDIEPKRLSPDIIESLSVLHPDTFKMLDAFRNRYKDLYSVSVTYYSKELRFYLTMLGFLDKIKEAGIPLTFPEISKERKISVKEAYDVSLLAKNEKHIVPNDIEFTESEPFFYLTGANGGGKTTYLRTVGIAAVLYMNGCPLPCLKAEIGEISSVFTHFPRDERFDGSGRFVEENGRVQKILEDMDSNSLVLLNETYSATNEENAVKMTEKLANELCGKNIFGLYITHQHSLAKSDIPYLNVLIDRNDRNRRTYKIARQKSTGGSFAADILERYGLTEEALKTRFGDPDE